MKEKNVSDRLYEYQLLLDYSQELVLFFDESGTIIDCNRTAKDKLGYGEEIFRIPVVNIFRKAMKIEMNKVVIDPRYVVPEETVAYRENQTCMTVNLKVTLKRDRQETIGICTAVDITDKKEALRELRQMEIDLQTSDQEKNEFVANITHELRTPVNGIMGLTNYLLETELSPKQVETVNIIHRCCTNMNAIINDLLDYTKIANNKLVLEHREFNFRRFIDNVISMNSNSISEKGLKLIVNVADDIPTRVIGDEFRLTQIMNNLLSNAVKFTSYGEIALEVVKMDQNNEKVELFFMVMDTGIGISLEEKDKLFQSFTQVDSSITKRFGGTGLGLSISKMLVEAMQGNITVESEKDHGSTFSFSVHLEISEGSEEAEEYDSQEKEDTLLYKKKDSSNISELDYLGRLLDDAVASSRSVNSLQMEGNFQNGLEIKDERRNFMDIMEKLVICIEMESWEKAEDYAANIKKIVPKDNKKLCNNALRLVLAVRKEEHDTSLQILDEIKEMINEEF